MQVKEKSTQEKCPFGGGDDDPPPTKKEYLKYMRGLSKVGNMDAAQRREWAIKEAARMQYEVENGLDDSKEPEDKEPTVDITAPGVESVNRTTLSEIRNANKHDLLVTFYAPWCPHCKEFVTSANAPIKALSASLETKKGPRVITFDITATDAPEALDVTSVPTVFLIKTTGEAIEYKQNPHDLPLLMSFALGDPLPAPKASALIAKPVSQHLRKPAL
jgi:thiol-disulfide isomerase/thioredoxin